MGMQSAASDLPLKPTLWSLILSGYPVCILHSSMVSAPSTLEYTSISLDTR